MPCGNSMPRITCTTLLVVASITSIVSPALFVTKIHAVAADEGSERLRTHSARTSQSGSF